MPEWEVIMLEVLGDCETIFHGGTDYPFFLECQALREPANYVL